MQKWSHYCDETMLALFGPDSERTLTLDESNALLQHYGWRSFFIDATKDLSVAAWFASHEYESNKNIVVTEDCYEQGVFCAFNIATYTESNSYGYLYIISREVLKNSSIEIHDLYKLGFLDFTPRYVAQSGVLIGPCDSLIEKSIVEVFKVHHEVLLEASNRHSTESLFPNREKDLVYKILLSTPFESIHKEHTEGSEEPPFYRRSLDIPEYDFKFTKINSPQIAFYNNDYAVLETDSTIGKIFRCPDYFLYHTEIPEPDNLEGLTGLLSIGESLTVECQGLLRPPPFHDQCEYIKGAHLTRLSEDLYIIRGITVTYKGMQLIGFQIDQGWHYKIIEGMFSRFQHDDDCPCNYDRRHQLSLTILKKANISYINGGASEKDGFTYLALR